jgi:hypothetical protein
MCGKALIKEVVMDDWRKKIDKFREKERLLQEEAKKKAETAKKNNEQESRREQLHGFRCHICHTPARIPGTKYGHDEYGASMPSNDWSIPGDLYRCERCVKWTCKKHLHKGICPECAEKL